VASLFNKTVLIIMLCLILVGQSMASVTMFYSMASMSSAPSKMLKNTQPSNDLSVKQSMPHCNENMLDESFDTESKEQCCAQDCQCLTGSCSSASAFSKTIAYTGVQATPVKIHFIHHNIATQIPPSLYRPPILS
jgi:hypothetical protein